jgi:hypothetical protein
MRWLWPSDRACGRRSRPAHRSARASS